MPKDTFKIGQKATYTLKLAGKVQKIVKAKDAVHVVHFYPFKPKAGKPGRVTPMLLSCDGACQDFVIYRGVRYNYYACESTISPAGITATCHYR
jgi:hypothetical protein